MNPISSEQKNVFTRFPEEDKKPDSDEAKLDEIFSTHIESAKRQIPMLLYRIDI